LAGRSRPAAPSHRPWRLRPLRRADRDAIRAICVTCAWMGRPASRRIVDATLWADYWTRLFTDRRRDSSWVVARADDACVKGYLTGVADVRQFDRHAAALMPRLVGRVVRGRLLSRPATRRGIGRFLWHGLVRHELALPPGLARQFPATFHMNLLPQARRQGLGTRLFEAFAGAMRSRAVPGIHLEVLGVNEPIRAFCRRAGFTRVASRSVNVFRHVDPRPTELETWVLALQPGRDLLVGAQRAVQNDPAPTV